MTAPLTRKFIHEITLEEMAEQLADAKSLLMASKVIFTGTEVVALATYMHKVEREWDDSQYKDGAE